MANPIYDAMVASMAEQMNPQNKMAAEWMHTQIDSSHRDNRKGRAEEIRLYRQYIAEAIAEHAEPDIVEAYKELLRQAAGKK